MTLKWFSEAELQRAFGRAKAANGEFLYWHSSNESD